MDVEMEEEDADAPPGSSQTSSSFIARPIDSHQPKQFLGFRSAAAPYGNPFRFRGPVQSTLEARNPADEVRVSSTDDQQLFLAFSGSCSLAAQIDYDSKHPLMPQAASARQDDAFGLRSRDATSSPSHAQRLVRSLGDGDDVAVSVPKHAYARTTIGAGSGSTAGMIQGERPRTAGSVSSRNGNGNLRRSSLSLMLNRLDPGGDEIPSPVAENRQVLPAINRLLQDSKSLAVAECSGEREMHMKFRLSRSCSDLCFPTSAQKRTKDDSCLAKPIAPFFQPSSPTDSNQSGDLPVRFQVPFMNREHENSPSAMSESSTNGVDTDGPSNNGQDVLKNGNSNIAAGSPYSSASMMGSPSMSNTDSPEPAMSPVGFFTTPSSPGAAGTGVGRTRSGSQSPYRRTYTSPNSSNTVHLRQSILGKRKPEEMEELKESLSKRLCSALTTQSSESFSGAASGSSDFSD